MVLLVIPYLDTGNTPTNERNNMDEKKIESLAYDDGFENVGTEDLDPALVPDVDENWEIWNRAWLRGRADAKEEAINNQFH